MNDFAPLLRQLQSQNDPLAISAAEAIRSLVKVRDEMSAKLKELDQQEPVAFANSDELDNILEDCSCIVLGVEDGFHRTPLYRHTTFKHRPAGD